MSGVQPHSEARSAASLLGWWRDAGVDLLVEEVPQPWIGRAAATAKPAAEAPTPALLPSSLSAFVDWLATGDNVPAAGPAARRIAPTGAPGSPIMVIVDIPDTNDLAAGHLLSGDVGHLFDRMLSAIGLTRDKIYLAPLCPGRPPSGQIGDEHLPRLAEIARQHVKLAAPKHVWLLGQTTSRAILGIDAVAARGKLHLINHNGGNVEVVASLHPRLLLRNPARKAGTWADMQVLIKGISG